MWTSFGALIQSTGEGNKSYDNTCHYYVLFITLGTSHAFHSHLSLSLLLQDGND